MVRRILIYVLIAWAIASPGAFAVVLASCPCP
jgi:hypothetical protein